MADPKLQDIPTLARQTYAGVRTGLKELSNAVYAAVDEDRRRHDQQTPSAIDTSRGLDYVVSIVTTIATSSSEPLRNALIALKNARALLENDAHYDVLRKPETWRSLWTRTAQDEEFASQFRRMAGDNGAHVGDRRLTQAGYVFTWDNNQWLPADADAALECLMEFLAGVWCGLLFFGIRADTLWNRLLQLASDETNGLPSGVCVYKAYGDVYRHALRELESLHEFKALEGSRQREVRIIDRENLRVRHLLMNPCIFGSVDISPVNGVDRPVDVSDTSFRRIGALYYLVYQIAYMRSRYYFTLIWFYKDEAEFKKYFTDVEAESGKPTALVCDVKSWIRYAYGESGDDRELVLPDGRRKYAFWACPRATFTQPPCVLGLRYGVITVDASPGTTAGSDAQSQQPFLVSSVPFGARRVGDAMFESLKLVVRSVAEQIRGGLEVSADASRASGTKIEKEADGRLLEKEGGPERCKVHDLLVHAFK